MPLSLKWSAFNKDNVLAESNSYGIYEIGDKDGKIATTETMILLTVGTRESPFWYRPV